MILSLYYTITAKDRWQCR